MKVALNNIGSKEEIRLMDNLMRQAKLNYPSISPYRINARTAGKTINPRCTNWINDIGNIVDEGRKQDEGKGFLDIIMESTKRLKRTHFGDCAEASSLIMSALIANGYKDGTIAHLYFKAEAKDLNSNQFIGEKLIDTTHEFVVRHLDMGAFDSEPKTYGKNLIIIDAWEDFCGNLLESFNRYFYSFLGGMREWINEDKNEKPAHEPIKITYKQFFHFCNFGTYIDEQDIETFRKAFPDLIIKK